MQNLPRNTEEKTDDPELNSLNELMEKILDIQHPERISQNTTQTSPSNAISFPVTRATANPSISLLEGKEALQTINQRIGFYGLEEADDTLIPNAIEAEVAQNQTLTSGSTVKLRLLSDLMVNGALIPQNTFVCGVASFANERLLVTIAGIRFGKALYPVHLTAFDLDGLEGIYVPGSVERESVKQSAGQSLESVELSALDPTGKAQAASAGFSALKSLLGKKVKQKRITPESRLPRFAV